MMDPKIDTALLLHLAAGLMGEWKDVARNLGLEDPTIFQIIADDSGRVKEQMYQMLLSWKQKFGPDATGDNLCEALKKAGRADLALFVSNYEPHPEKPSYGHAARREIFNDTKSKFIETLRKRYKRMCSLVKPIPWQRNNKNKASNLFIDVGVSHLERGEDSGDEKNWTRKPKISAIFTDEILASANRIVVEGGPGCGKTTLMLQYAYLWSEKMYPMENIDVFILLPLKLVEPKISVYKTIKKMLLPRDTDLTENDIDNILHTERVVLSFDGLDECPGRSSDTFENSDIMSSLKGEMLEDVKVIVSTRLSCLTDLTDCDIERVRLQKFEMHHWQTYVNKITSKESQVGLSEAILRIIREQKILQTLCEVPLFMALLTQFIREDVKSKRDIKFHSVTEVFKHIITCMRAHHANKKLRNTPIGDDNYLEEIAFTGLLPASKAHVWDKKKLQLIPSYQDMIDSGILIEEEGEVSVGSSLSEIELYPTTTRFLHQLFQEWYGARHLERLCNSTEVFQEALKEINPDELHYLLRFTCGLNSNATKIILHRLCKLRWFERDAFCLCFTEYTGDKRLIRDVISQRCSCGFTLKDNFSQNDDLRAKIKLLKHTSESKIPVEKVTIFPKGVKVDSVIIAPGVLLEPLPSAEIIQLEKWPGDEIISWLRLCSNLKELLINHPDERARADHLSRILDERRTKVLMEIQYHGFTYGLRKGKWEKTHAVKCNGCDSSEILGICYRCMDCGQYNQCNNCMRMNRHSNHQFRRISGTERRYDTSCICEKNIVSSHCTENMNISDYHFREQHGLERYRCVVCCGCEDELTETLYYRCKSCRYFIICESCRRSGIHKGHEFVKRDRHEVTLHYDTECNICKERPLEGNRYRCFACEDFNLCECCKERGEHNEHNMMMYSGKNWHPSFRCDFCRATVGFIFQCKTCPEVRLCEFCKEIGKHSKHDFQIIEENEMLYNATCAVCHEHPVRGRPFERAPRSFEKFCERCINANLHVTYNVSKEYILKLDSEAGECAGCKSLIKSQLYNCGICRDYQLCGCCIKTKIPTMHSRDHKYSEIEEIENLTDLKCDGCMEPLLDQQRFSCKTCLRYHLCETCINTDIYHKHNTEHEYRQIEEGEFERGRVQTDRLKCDACKQFPLRGRRYSCNTCRDYYLCESCSKTNTYLEHNKEHELEQLETNVIPQWYGHCDGGCGEYPRTGRRFKCKTCFNFSLCETCINKDIHHEHQFKIYKIEKSLKIEHCHRGINCNGCKMKNIGGNRYRCRTCLYFNLCESCKFGQVHQEHDDFRRFDGTEVKHTFVQCNICQEQPIIGERYKCKTCLWFNICGNCKNDQRKFHEDHEFGEIQQDRFPVVECNLCQQLPIIGVRFKCKRCVNFNICKNCKLSRYDNHKDHNFEQIVKNDDMLAECYLCKEFPVKGPRYKCTICPSFNLCESCRRCTDIHEHNDYQEITKFIHTSIQCDICRDLPIIGVRYKCKICPNFNFCEKCRQLVKYLHNHEYEDISPEKHISVQCNICREVPIIGVRYKCKICPWFNLCKSCKENEYHEDHEFEEIRKVITGLLNTETY